jgi:hypothetical protein
MGYNTVRTIYLVVSKGEKIKAFGSHGLALEYKHNFCPDGKIEEVTLFEKPVRTERSCDPDDPDDRPRKRYEDDSGY